MNVFDFDGTIYDGDSSIDFWLFCIKKQPTLLRFLPKQFLGVFLYFLGKITKEEFKSRFFLFFSGITNMDVLVKDFWDKKNYKIKIWYKIIKQKNDCIISASPHFLLEEICNRLNIQNLIATDVDKNTGNLLSKNCHGKNKVDFFTNIFGIDYIDCFYSDTDSDFYLAHLAKKAFKVKRNKIIEWRYSDDK